MIMQGKYDCPLQCNKLETDFEDIEQTNPALKV